MLSLIRSSAALSDRTQTRWGKFRPWILWTALPFGLIFWLVYVTPDFGPSAKLVYAYITYTLLMMMYSANNTPYSALMGVMTPDSSERSSIASYRFVGALIGQFIIQALPLPLVAKLGHGDSAKGWAMTMAIFGALIVVLNLITFASTSERVQPPPGEKPSIAADFKDVFSCGPWIVMFVLTLLVFTMLVVRGSSSNYLFAYYLDQGRSGNFSDKFGLAEGAGELPDSGAPTLNALGSAGEAGRVQRRRRRLELVLRHRKLRSNRRNHLLQAARGPLRQEGRLYRRCYRHHDRHRLGILGDAIFDRHAFLVEHSMVRRVGANRSSALGDDCRRGRLLGVEELPPCHGIHVCRNSVCA